MLSPVPNFDPREAVAHPSLGSRDNVASLPGCVARLSRHRRMIAAYSFGSVASVSLRSRLGVAS